MIASLLPVWSCTLAPSGHPALRAGTGSRPDREEGNRAGTTPPPPSSSTHMKNNYPCRFVVVVSACL